MLFENAAVHNHGQSSRAGLPGRGFMDYSLLQPNRWNIEPDSFVDDLGDELGTPEDVDHVDLLRNLGKASVGFGAEHFALVGIHRNNAISLALHVLRDAEARTHRVRRKADH